MVAEAAQPEGGRPSQKMGEVDSNGLLGTDRLKPAPQRVACLTNRENQGETVGRNDRRDYRVE